MMWRLCELVRWLKQEWLDQNLSVILDVIKAKATLPSIVFSKQVDSYSSYDSQESAEP